MATKNGMKPISQKPKTAQPYNLQNFFRNKLALDPSLQESITKSGKEWRFINLKKFQENGNYHEWGWEIYRTTDTSTAQGFMLGHNPDGIVRRGDAVLAVRPTEICEQHRAYLSDKAALQSSKQFQKQKAKELRQLARDNQVDAVVHEGYDEEEENQEV